jgi:hypothetical protein
MFAIFSLTGGGREGYFRKYQPRGFPGLTKETRMTTTTTTTTTTKTGRLRWPGASPRQAARWRRRLYAWSDAHLWPEAAAAAAPWVARCDGPAAYAAGWAAAHADERAAATTTHEIPDPITWEAGDASGTWGSSTESPHLLRCDRVEEWPIPWAHWGCSVLRTAWGRIAAREAQEEATDAAYDVDLTY